ncbi:MAG: 4-hydroxy-tetrahydrodipicolinate reductase [Muribaculaceae bacterium]|nr:4-hydroxy-tetrahydrodipicolinate reductase [Muribaculaceae bacterium]
MKIALIGYGKMGKTIERIALGRGHEIVSIIDIYNQSDIDSDAFRSADVAIEFTTPSTAVDNYLKAFAQGVPVVSGSTGWTTRMPEIKAICEKGEATFFWTSNFSLGVNIFFAVNKYLASLMDGFNQYRPEMTEIHHIHKLDHPSGTAITLAEGLIDKVNRINEWTEETNSNGKLLINHQRHGEVPGTHIVSWESEVDTITIEHKAKSREGFALGAVIAAEWVKGRKGFLTMNQLMHGLVVNNQLLDIIK